ncbi:helix-turn-helix transcriptional regulator [Paenibacillus sp. R14(2021)]|uniref:helix-turn-helix domain-containing protein n=1 Tax=Paenibacillus sp. R14(2021) TaxID=2859228 RepID=UPI001C6160B3|nr:helix-turn-helix transcriptional regulator [Paenibacillus sp. R14(2021)]
MILTTAVFQSLKTPLAVVIGQGDQFHFNLANKAFSALVDCPEEVLEGLHPGRLFAEWNSSTLQSSTHHETSLLQCRSDEESPRLLLSWQVLENTVEPAYLLTAEDISAKSWIDLMSETHKVLQSGILNDKFVVERYFQYYPSPLFDRLFVEEESLSSFFEEYERERILAMMEQSIRHRRTNTIIVQTKRLADSAKLELHITYRPFFNGDGSLKQMGFIVTNIQSITESAVVDSSVTLKVLMARNYISAQELASTTGISLQTISKLRNGKIGRPQRQTALQIAKALKVLPQDIWP